MIGDPKFKQWDAKNSMVISWLIKPMELEISQVYLFSLTTKELWETINEDYINLGNVTQQFELRTRHHDTKQGNISVTNYYPMLSGLQQEYDLYADNEWKCTTNSLKYQQMQERNIIFILYKDIIFGGSKEIYVFFSPRSNYYNCIGLRVKNNLSLKTPLFSPENLETFLISFILYLTIPYFI